jgi:hypothetical protein
MGDGKLSVRAVSARVFERSLRDTGRWRCLGSKPIPSGSDRAEVDDEVPEIEAPRAPGKPGSLQQRMEDQRAMSAPAEPTWYATLRGNYRPETIRLLLIGIRPRPRGRRAPVLLRSDARPSRPICFAALSRRCSGRRRAVQVTRSPSGWCA